MKKPMAPPDVESLIDTLLSSGDAGAFRDAFVVGGLVMTAVVISIGMTCATASLHGV